MSQNPRPRRWRRASAAAVIAVVAAALLAGTRSATPPLAAAASKPEPLKARLLPPTQLAVIRAAEPARTAAALAHARAHFAGHPVRVDVKDAHTDALGRTHVRLLLIMNIGGYAGVHFNNIGLAAHVDMDGTLSLEAFPPAHLPTSLPGPSVSLEEAGARARQVGERVLSARPVLLPTSLVLDESSGRSVPRTFEIVYEVRTELERSGTPDHLTIVDFAGSVRSRRIDGFVESRDRLPPSVAARRPVVQAPARPPLRANDMVFGDGQSYYSGRVWLNTWRIAPDRYRLCNPALGSGVGGTCVYSASNANDVPGSAFYEKNVNEWGNGERIRQGDDPLGPTGETAAVDALWGVTWAWELLRALGASNGPRPDGAALTVDVHAINQGTITDCKPYATTGRISFPFPCRDDEPREAPDAVGQTLAHVDYMFRASNPQVTEDERGATIEATADILGEMTEFYMRGFVPSRPWYVPDFGGDFIHRGDVAGVSRDRFFKPSLNGGLDFVPPGHPPGQLRGNRYLIGGPLRRAFYFMSRGARPYVPGDPQSEMYGSPLVPEGFRGLGNDAATRIWYHAIPYFGNGWFVDVKRACVRSAYDLYGFDVLDVISNAFTAVGIRTELDEPVVTLTAAQQEHHRKVFVAVSVMGPFAIARLVDPFGDYRRLHEGSRYFEYAVGSGDDELPTGEYSVTVEAYGHDAHTETKTVTFTVDADGPTVSVQDITAHRTLRRHFRAEAEDPAGVHRVELSVDNRTPPATRQEAPYDFEIDFRNGPYGDGPHRVVAKAFDRWGNSAEGSTTLTTDRSIEGCEIAAVDVNFPNVTTTLRAVDHSGATVIFEAWIDYAPVWNRTSPVGPPTHTATERDTRPLSLGRHLFEARCTDRWGNSIAARPVEKVISAPPIVTWQVRAEYNEVVITYDVRDDTGLRNMKIYRDDRDGHNLVQEIPWLDGRRQATGTIRLSNLSIGPHQFSARAWDVDGYWASPDPVDVVTRPRPVATPTPVPRCNDTVRAGGNAAETHRIKLGRTSGNLTMYMQFYQIPDRIIVRYEGRQLWDTGCLSGTGTGPIGSFRGTSDEVEVQVIPNCAGTPDTDWEFKVFCPS